MNARTGPVTELAPRANSYPELSPAGAALHTFTDWAADVRAADLPSEVSTRLSQAVRDALGCATFGADLPWVRMVADAMTAQSGGQGAATIWSTGQRVDPIAAALANGVAVQGFELDDLHAGASLHGSSTMLPSTLALAELTGGLSGAELLAALAVGWEAGVRVNRCLGDILVAGWHTPTMMGTIAAATAAGRVLRLSPAQLYECVSLAVLQASGLTVVQFGGMAKRLYAGRAAEIGIHCALLAQRGFTAPPDAFGHQFGGFLNTFAPSREHDTAALTRDLGSDFATAGVSFKLYSCCGIIQGAIDMLAEMVEEHPGLRAEDVVRIEVRMTEHGHKHAGFEYVPDTAVTAQFSVQYCLAVYLLEGACFVDQFRDDLLGDSDVLDLVKRIHVRTDPTLQTEDRRSKRATGIQITLRSGHVLQREGMLARGHADRPASEQQLRAKFDRLMLGAMGTDRAEQLSVAALGLASLEDVTQLVALASSELTAPGAGDRFAGDEP